MIAPTREQVEEWVRDAGLDWHKGFISDDCPLNRYEALISLAFSAGQSGQASGSGAKLVREIEECAGLRSQQSNDPMYEYDLRDMVACPLWPRLRAALLSGDAAREDAERLHWLQEHTVATGLSAFVHNSGERFLVEAIDRARGGK